MYMHTVRMEIRIPWKSDLVCYRFLFLVDRNHPICNYEFFKDKFCNLPEISSVYVYLDISNVILTTVPQITRQIVYFHSCVCVFLGFSTGSKYFAEFFDETTSCMRRLATRQFLHEMSDDVTPVQKKHDCDHPLFSFVDGKRASDL